MIDDGCGGKGRGDAGRDRNGLGAIHYLHLPSSLLFLLYFVWCWLFLRVRGFWGECSTIYSPPALFFFFLWRLARANLFHSIGQDQSTVAQRAETIVTEFSLTSCVGARFLIDAHSAWIAAWSAHSDFDGSRVHACLGITLQLHF